MLYNTMDEKDYSENYKRFKIWISKGDNKERFKDMKRNYAYNRYQVDAGFRERIKQSREKWLAKKLKEEPEYNEVRKATNRRSNHRYYHKNIEMEQIKKLGRYYMLKLYNTREDYDDVDEWFFKALRGCKRDDVCEWVVDNIEEYVEKRDKIYSDKLHNEQRTSSEEER